MEDREPLPVAEDDPASVKRYKGLANRLLVFARAKGWSQTTLAARIRSTTTNAGRYLDALNQPDFDTLSRIGTETNLSLDWLVLGEGGEGPVHRGQARAQPKLEMDVAAHVRRTLEEHGLSPFELERFTPSADAMLEGATRWAQAEVRVARRAARQRYRQAIEVFARCTGPYQDLPDKVRAEMSDHVGGWDREYAIELRSLALAVVRAAAKPTTELPPLLQFGPFRYDFYAFVVQLPDDARCEFALVSELSPELEAAMDADVLLTHDNAWSEDVANAKAASAFADWCAAQRWTEAPDPHYEGYSRWRWSGRCVDAELSATSAA